MGGPGPSIKGAAPQEVGLRKAENPFSAEPVHLRVLSFVHFWGPLLQVKDLAPRSPAAPASPEHPSPSKKTKKATSGGQLPNLAPQEDKVRRLNQGWEREAWGRLAN